MHIAKLPKIRTEELLEITPELNSLKYVGDCAMMWVIAAII